MMVSVLVTRTCGPSAPKRPVSAVFTSPCGPSNATKPMATTMVGMMKGSVVSAFSTVLPGNSCLANRYAAGRPTISVRAVETAACQMVNQMRPR